MSRRAIRILVIFALGALGGLLAIQIIWFSRAYDLQQRQFSKEVNLALREVAHQLRTGIGDTTNVIPPVSQTASNAFYVRLESPLVYEQLYTKLEESFDRREIDAAYSVGLLRCDSDELFLGFLKGEGEGVSSCLGRETLEDCYNVSLSFPNQQAYLMQGLYLWGILAIVFLFVLAFFSYSLYIMLKERRLSELRRDFINNLTHELKTPIANIAVASEVLKAPENSLDIHKTRRYAGIIHKENERLLKQVDQVLQMAFLDNKGLELKVEKININELIEEILQSISPRIEGRKGRITFTPGAEPPTVWADRFHLTNVIFSLVDNAEKYSLNKPEISISTAKKAEGLWISVADKGVGIAKEALDNIFDRFYRVATGDLHAVKGFGLGLSYAKSIIEAHGGQISVQSQIKKGSTFSFFLSNDQK